MNAVDARAEPGPEEDGMAGIRWTKKAASRWFSLLRSSDVKGVGVPTDIAPTAASGIRPRFPTASALARLELGSVLSTPAHRDS